MGIRNKASYEAYLNDMFSLAINAEATLKETISDMLYAKASSYGRTGEDAKADVKGILNIKAAVKALLRDASESFNNESID
jgi:hypothetical protein